MRKHSPYNYAFNNPIRFIDPDGMLSKDFIHELWSKSGNETIWTNQGDGAFSDGNKTVKEQDPPLKSQRISQGGEKVYSNINDPIERVFRWFVPREYKDPITGKTLEVDNDGLTVGSMLTGTPDLMGGFKPSSIIRFGKGANQVSHTFRHIIDAGFKRSDVEGEIVKEIMKNHQNIPNEKLQVGSIIVKGVKLDFNYFKKDGVINVGRITTPK